MSTTLTTPQRSLRWRVVDIVVAAVIAVASGLIFVGWNVGTEIPRHALEALLPGLQGLFNGGWLFAGVLGGLVIRKPGAALFVALVAALLSALVGNQWGPLTLVSGAAQGLGAELVFLAFLYGNFRLYVAMLSGALAGLATAINDLVIWYPGADVPFATIYIVTSIVSGIVIAGIGSWALARALAATGALNRFAAGREGRSDV
ncbi:MAG TPA: ECF transporter S component [Pseudolysinimonas sp.]|nr:ECF transporter S component [Pseudolysinimonas sp.]